ncbi:hypothetical protein [Natrinema marinum]|uniref:hypothetical protein n=1 Tax=Natrinema marinum TaxID=2961598 RepID=UPI0020C8687B|nr:hypothetical protein [Natrinema marinum]
MATDNASGFQTADAPGGNYDDDNAEWQELPDEGEVIQGIILNLAENSGQFDQLRVRYKSTHGSDEGDIRLVHFNRTLEDRVHANDIQEGHEFRLEGTGTYTWEDDDGNEREGTERTLQFRE